jgi:spore coat protein U-like protein
VTVTCALSLPYKVALNRGLGGSGTARRMTFANGVVLTYEIYQDSAKTVVWGDSDVANTYPPGSSFAGTGTGAAQPLTVYGVVPAGQNPAVLPSEPIGADTITVTVVF